MNAAATLARQGEASEPEQRLLDFVASLIFDLARTHPRITDEQVALWLARVAMGER
jgi:hypothetical protein